MEEGHGRERVGGWVSLDLIIGSYMSRLHLLSFPPTLFCSPSTLIRPLFSGLLRLACGPVLYLLSNYIYLPPRPIFLSSSCFFNHSSDILLQYGIYVYFTHNPPQDCAHQRPIVRRVRQASSGGSEGYRRAST